MSVVVFSEFVKDCLEDWYGEFNVSPVNGSSHTYRVDECFTVRVDSPESLTLLTSQALGPARAWSGSFLDVLVDKAEQEFPRMRKRALVQL